MSTNQRNSLRPTLRPASRPKCYWCGKKDKLGMHDICWENLKSFALSSSNTPNPVEYKRPEDVPLNQLSNGLV